MCRWMLALIDFRVKSNKDLSEEMRNLFSVGYKNEVGSRRASFRVFQHVGIPIILVEDDLVTEVESSF